MLVEEINFRPIKENDINFVMNAWLKSYRNSDFVSGMLNAVYFENHAKIIQALLARSVVIVACNPEEEDQIYGFICYEAIGDVVTLHYVYVKFPYRKFGIGNQLFRFAQPDEKGYVLSTHIPKNPDALFKKYNVIFNPYKL